MEPYNAVMSFYQLVENADEGMLLDNKALYDIGSQVAQRVGLLSHDTQRAAVGGAERRPRIFGQC